MGWNEKSSAVLNGRRHARFALVCVMATLIALMGVGWNVVTAQQDSPIAQDQPRAVHHEWRAVSRDSAHQVAGDGERVNIGNPARETIQDAASAPAAKLPQTDSESDSCIPHWDGTIGQPGMNGSVRALTVFDDGSGPALYAGGSFITAGGVQVNYIARWDGESWSPLGSGMNERVHALTVFDDGSGPALYAGGEFTTAGGVEVNHIARWDGESWSALGSGMGGATFPPWVFALTVFDDGSGSGPALYAGGNFFTAGGQAVNRIASWDGSVWHAFGSGVNGSVAALTVWNGELIAGGQFNMAGWQTVNRIARWDGSAWHAFASGGQIGVNNTVTWGSLTVYNGDLIAGGHFSTAGGQTVSGIARWDGSAWHPFASGGQTGVHPPPVWRLMVWNGDLIAGGAFTTAGGQTVNRIARWDGESWSALGSGMNSWVGALTVFDDGSGPALYAGGGFTMADGGFALRIARWQDCPQEPPCAFADLNCDDVVNGIDLIELLSQWGPCRNCNDCPADLNGDCTVNGFDLVILLSNWG